MTNSNDAAPLDHLVVREEIKRNVAPCTVAKHERIVLEALRSVSPVVDECVFNSIKIVIERLEGLRVHRLSISMHSHSAKKAAKNSFASLLYISHTMKIDHTRKTRYPEESRGQYNTQEHSRCTYSAHFLRHIIFKEGDLQAIHQ